MLSLRYRNTIVQASWGHIGTQSGYRLACPRCQRLSLLATPFLFTVDTEMLTVQGILECRAPTCDWRGTITKGIIEDAR
jgi:hypothetical protein